METKFAGIRLTFVGQFRRDSCRSRQLQALQTGYTSTFHAELQYKDER